MTDILLRHEVDGGIVCELGKSMAPDPGRSTTSETRCSSKPACLALLRGQANRVAMAE